MEGDGLSTNRLPPLQALRAFDAVVHHMSFAKAAKALSVTPAAISHQIKGLEDWLGVRLFRRLSHGIELTREGRNLAPDVRDAFSRLASGVTRIREDNLSGILRVSVSPSLASKWLVSRLERFSEKQPQIDIRLNSTSSIMDFSRDGVDVAIRFGAGNYPDCTVDLLFVSEVFPTCSPDLIKQDHSLKHPRDLKNFVLLHDSNSEVEGRLPDWRTWLTEAGVREINLDRGPRFNNVYLAIDAAVAGQGVVLAPGALVADAVAAGKLIRPFALALKGTMSFYVVAPKAGSKRPKVNAFRRWLISEAQNTPPVPVCPLR
jgi:LysR family transcriptional regulator, glycine cleavage system transcriptional activator